MSVKLLAGASALAFALAASSSAMAGQANANGAGNDTATNTEAAIALNVLLNVHANQPIRDNALRDADNWNNSARVQGNTQQNAVGINQASAQSGIGTMTAQGNAVAAVGNVDIGN